ncbi:MAG: hypothetical protein GY757_04745, partial [bacterium]|nr:hypothetical protein [bacterium]
MKKKLKQELSPVKSKKRGAENIANVMALTPMQQGMLFHYLREPLSGLYFEQLSLELFTFELAAKVEKEPFEKAWNFVIQSNEMLRTTFRWEKIKNPVQTVLKQHLIKPRYYTFQEARQAPDSQAVWLEKIKAEDRRESFDLKEVPFRVTLCKHETKRYTLIISNHHILYDGWSNGIILKEFFSAYEAFTKGKSPAPISKTKFEEYIKWQQQRDKNNDKTFWKDYLKSLTAKPAFPGGPEKPVNLKSRSKTGVVYPGRKVKSTESRMLTIPAETKTQMDQLVKKQDITRATLLYCTWGLLLKQYHGDWDILFDTTVAGRTAKIKGIEKIAGLFINTLPIHLPTKPGDSVTDFLKGTATMLRKWSQYENSSRLELNEYLEELQNSRQNLFDTLMVIENYPLDKIAIQASNTLPVKNVCYSGRTLYDLTAIITDFESLKIEITYNKELFDNEAAENMCGYFLRLLREIAGNPGKDVSSLDIVPEEERTRIRKAVNALCEPENVGKIEYTAPQNKTEEKLAEIWSTLLRLDKKSISSDMDFFQLGGHSLKATMLTSQIHKQLEIKMPLTMVFKHPTIKEQAEYINRATKAGYEAMEPVEKKEYYPASPAQKRMVTLKQMEPESIAYNVTAVLLMEGPLAKDGLTAFENSFKNVLHRHESLRTSFGILETGETGSDGEIVQKIQKEVDFNIEHFNLQAPDTDKPRDLQPETGIINRFIRPFDLSRAPLIRVGVLKLEEQKHILMFDAHHIVSDGTSMKLFIDEFMAYTSGKRLPTLSIQYKDYSVWQERRFMHRKEELEQQKSYWLNRYSGELPVLNLPTDYPATPERLSSGDGDTLIFKTGKDLREKIREIEKNSGATLYMILMAAYTVLLMKYSGKEDIVVGTITDGRPHPDMKTIIGVMIATLAVRNYPTREKNFADFLQEVKQDSLHAFENSDYPFEALLKHFTVNREINRNPLFDTMFLLQNYEWTELTMENLTFKPYHFKKNASTFQLRLTATEFENEKEIEIEIQYATRLFKETTIRSLSNHYINILKEVTAKPQKTLGEIDILTEAERHKILVEFNDSTKDTGEIKTVYQLFEEQVEKTPENIAIVGKEETVGSRQYAVGNEKIKDQKEIKDNKKIKENKRIKE